MTATSDDDQPVTRGQFNAYARKVKKKFKKIEDLIGDAFVKIGDVEEHGLQMQDEAIDKADRAQRAVRRLKKEFDAME